MAQYYVSPIGNDASPGTLALPFLTLSHAHSVLVAGDVCYVLDGTYTLTSSFIITTSGTSDSARITYLSLNQSGAKLVNNITVTDSSSDATVQINADFIDFTGFDVSGSGRIGIYNSGSSTGSGSPLGSHNRIRSNYVHDLGMGLDSTHNVSGINGSRYGSGIYNAVYNEVSGNVLKNIGNAHNSGSHGIYFGTAHGTFFNNIVSGVPGYGIRAFHFSHHMTIANNLVFNCGDNSLDPAGGAGGGIYISAGGTGWTAGVDEPHDFSVITNNIVKDCVGWGGILETANNFGAPNPQVVANNTFSNNCAFNNSGVHDNVELDSGTPNLNPLLNPPTSTTSGNDTFVRANQSGFGTATDGQSWANSGDTVNVQLSILSNQGKVTNSTAANYIVLGGTDYTGDGEVLVRISTSSAATNNAQGALLRYTDTTHWYAAYFHGTTLRIDSAIASLVSVAFTFVANTEYWLRFNITGTTLSAKVWADGGTEPGAWTASTTDSTLSTGKPGIYANPNSALTTAVYDTFTFVTIVTDPNFPFFINYQLDGSGDYHLAATSPCIDAGTSLAAPTTDLDGVSRPRGTTYDIGPYEFLVFVQTGYRVVIDGQPLFTSASDPNFVIAGSLSFGRSIGKRSQASLTVCSDGNTHYEQDQSVQIYDQNGVLAFSGYITQPQEQKPGFQDTLIHTITCTDQHRIADKRVVAASYTNKTSRDMVVDIYTNILAQEGISIGQIYSQGGLPPGPTVYPNTTLYPIANTGIVPSATFVYCTVAQAFDELVKSASASGIPFYWAIDQFKQLWFVPYNAVINPTLVDGTQIDDGRLSGTIPTVTRANPTYRNTQYILGGVAQTVTQNETRKGDGNTTSWPMNFDLASAPTITVNAVTKTVGIRGVDTGKDWYWQQGSPDISQDSAGTKLISTDTLAVTYIGQYPTVILTQNDAQITYEQGLDKTTGIVEEVETDSTITSLENGYATAGQLLTRYATQGTQFQFMTLDSQFVPGQLVTFDLPEYNLNTVDMLIESVNASDQQDGYNIWYSVTAILGPYDVSWQSFFSKLLVQQAPANSINVGASQSLTILQQFTGSVSITASFTATVVSCPLPGPTLYPSSTLYPC